jgi:isopentenyl diphosphate isomerase/L-lactate dehydrogenase-like FMN-dependent dehydrogenase
MRMDAARREFMAGGSAVVAALAASGSAAPGPALAQTDHAAAQQVLAADEPYRAGSGSRRLDIVSLRDLEQMAEKVIPRGGLDFIRGGAGDEWTMRENLAAFQRVAIEPNYLSGAKPPDISTTILGARLALPVITAPMGGHRLAHEGGEVATASGTAAAGSLVAISSVSNVGLEQVMAGSAGPKWFQIYLPEDRGLARELLQRSAQAGYRAVIVTIDTTAPGNRERDIRNQFRSPPELGHGNMSAASSGYAATAATFKHDLNWDDIAFVQKEAGVPVLIKGVLTPRLAAQALQRGVAGIFVSNHGGRQLDGVPATFTVLPKIADSVHGRIPIVLDGGVRRGQDVFKALAAGASCVAIGRPVLYGLALGGALGVESVYDRLRTEFAMTMQLAGVPNVASINKSYLYRELSSG